MADEVFQASQRRLLEGLVVKQVGTGIAGQTQLGENQDSDILVLGALHQGQDTPGVKATVGNPDGRRSRRDPDKSKPGMIGERHGHALSAALVQRDALG